MRRSARSLGVGVDIHGGTVEDEELWFESCTALRRLHFNQPEVATSGHLSTVTVGHGAGQCSAEAECAIELAAAGSQPAQPVPKTMCRLTRTALAPPAHRWEHSRYATVHCETPPWRYEHARPKKTKVAVAASCRRCSCGAVQAEQEGGGKRARKRGVKPVSETPFVGSLTPLCSLGTLWLCSAFSTASSRDCRAFSPIDHSSRCASVTSA